MAANLEELEKQARSLPGYGPTLLSDFGCR